MEPYRNYRHLEKRFGITWFDLAALEPKLEELLWAARQASINCRRWADVSRLISPIRNSLDELVGFAGKNRQHSVLGSTKAYEIAYWKLYDAVAELLPGPARGAEEPRAETVSGTHSISSAPLTVQRCDRLNLR
jgi:hypothetical protein